MKAQILRLVVLTLLAVALFTTQNVSASITNLNMVQQTTINESAFSSPLGLYDGITYVPRFTQDNLGNTIEDTDYGVKNDDLLSETTCFGNNIPLRTTYHAGEDLYHPDISVNTAGADVFAVADGEVRNVSDDTWPGRAIVIEHANQIYSVYIHVDEVNLAALQPGTPVSRGDKLGVVIQQAYEGRYPEYHTDSQGNLFWDSHLHFEIRYFGDGTNIYTNFPSCNGAMLVEPIPLPISTPTISRLRARAIPIQRILSIAILGLQKLQRQHLPPCLQKR